MGIKELVPVTDERLERLIFLYEIKMVMDFADLDVDILKVLIELKLRRNSK